MARTKIGMSLLNTNIVQVTTTTNTSTTSSTFTDTTLAATITPSSASSRVRIMVSGGVQVGAAGVNAMITVKRGSTNLGGTQGFTTYLHQGSVAGTARSPYAIVYVDSPATTSPTTYTVQIRNNDNTTAVVLASNNQETNVIILEEVN